MPKKITPPQRKELLKLHRKGNTYAQIMSELGIGDLRTLKKHLELAKEEEKQSQAEIKIIEDAQAKHLDEIRALIERWQKSIVMPLVIFNVYSAETPVCLEIERNPLFEGVKEHLPKALWIDYEVWKQKLEEYLTIDRKWPEEIKQQAKTTMMDLETEEDLPFEIKLKPEFSEPIIAAVKSILLGGMPEYVNYDARTEIGGICSLYADGVNVLDIIGDFSGATLEAYRKRYHQILNDCLQSEEMNALKTLLNEIQDLQKKIHKQLGEILLRRDYILYRCKFCPGQRPSR